MGEVICKCGSYAVNPHRHGREPGVDLHLCDVCYWRSRAERMQGRVAELEAVVRSYATNWTNEWIGGRLLQFCTLGPGPASEVLAINTGREPGGEAK